jgi:hypothetical protein
MQRYRRYYHLVVLEQALNHANTSICGAWANLTGNTTDCHLGQANWVKQGNLWQAHCWMALPLSELPGRVSPKVELIQPTCLA